MAEGGSEDIADSVSGLQLVPGSGEELDHANDVDDGDDDDDDEDEPTVIVGFVQKPEKPWSLSRHLFPSKAGGTPAWLDPINLPHGEDISCGICERPLQFLLQVYAPIEGKEEAFHRTLLVFMCPDMTCLQQDGKHQLKASREKSSRSVKVFRCQLRHINKYYSKEPPKSNGLDAPIAKGVPLCSWCGTWKGEKICGGCKQARYCSRHHQLEHWKSSHAAVCKAQGANSGKPVENMEGKSLKVERKAGTQQADVDHPACNKLWPEFEIIDEEEGCDDEESPSSAIIGSGKEDEISRQFQVVEPSPDQRHWANFQARLSRAPGQVLRYCRSPDAKPLWPRLDERPAATSIPACAICNGRRIFELQILPQLLYFFKMPNDPDALDWGTIAVYSCECSCISSKAYVEEFAWVQSV